MSDTSTPRVDPVEQVQRWLEQYLDHVQCPAVKKQLDHAVLFRLTRAMFTCGKSLDDMQAIIRELARGKTKPKGVGYLITVIESRLGKVA